VTFLKRMLCLLLEYLNRFCGCIQTPPVTPELPDQRYRIKLRDVDSKITYSGVNMGIVLKDTQQVDNVTITAKDKKGVVLPDPAGIVWSTTDENVCVVNDDPVNFDDDGVTPAKMIVAVLPGTAQVQATDGGTFIASVDVTVTPGDVAALEITVGGAVTEQP
jgi:hypothetical protein